MRSMKGAAFATVATIAVAFLGACSDAATAPTATRSAFVPKSSFVVAVGDPTTSLAEVGLMKVCKTGNRPGTFVVTLSAGQGGTGGGTAQTPLTVAPGDCRIAGIDNGDSKNSKGDFFHVSENADSDPNTVQTLETCIGVEGPAECTGTPGDGVFNNNYFVNDVHGVVITYANVLPAANVCDFSTFGGFVTSPAKVSYGGNAGFASSGFAYGDLNFVNHTTGQHAHVWNVTAYGHPDTGPLSGDEDSRLASGLGTVDGVVGDVQIEFRFLDAGEPAKKAGDKVYLIVGGDVWIPEQIVGGGNIQLHAKCKKAPKAEKH